MKIILMGRGAGKTTKLAAECIKNKGIFVAFCEHEAQRLRHDYPDMRVETAASLRNNGGMRGRNTPPVYVEYVLPSHEKKNH